MPGVHRFPTTRAETSSWAMSDIMVPAYMVTMAAEVDASALQRLRAKTKAQGAAAPSFTALVVKAAALTMQRHPEANRAVLGWPLFKRLYQFTNHDVSVAVEKDLPGLPGHAFAAPIKNALDKPLAAITDELQTLARCTEQTDARYRLYMRILRRVPHPFGAWLISLPHRVPALWAEHRGCACWVNAPSRAGVDLVATTWPWPITFSFGVVKPRAVVVEGDRIEARPTMPVVMAFDRRVMGGGPASRVFAEFQAILERADEVLQAAPASSSDAQAVPSADPAAAAAPGELQAA